MSSDSNRTRSDEVTDEELLDELWQCQQRHGTATPREYNQDDEFGSAVTILRRFGSWEEAEREAGIDESNLAANADNVEYGEAQILSALRELHRREGEATPALLQEHPDLYQISDVVSQFGSWEIAKQRAGLASKKPPLYTVHPEDVDPAYDELLNRCADVTGCEDIRPDNEEVC